MTKYSYYIIKENNPYFAQEPTLLKNNYKATKYAMIEKIVNKDGSENIANIYYSNDMVKLQNTASTALSWYNYPLSLKKDIQGNISQIM